MSDRRLRADLIRLASENPSLRAEILPLLKEGGEKTASSLTYAMNIKEAAVALVVASRENNAEAEGRALARVLQMCAEFAKRGRLHDAQVALRINKAIDLILMDGRNLAGDQFDDEPPTEPYEVAHGPRDSNW